MNNSLISNQKKDALIGVVITIVVVYATYMAFRKDKMIIGFLLVPFALLFTTLSVFYKPSFGGGISNPLLWDLLGIRKNELSTLTTPSTPIKGTPLF